MIIVLLMLALGQVAWAGERAAEALLPPGSYLPFFPPPSIVAGEAKEEKTNRKPVSLEAFWMERVAVSNREFLEFVRKNPEWRRSRIPRVFSDAGYLAHWKADLQLSTRADALRPVTRVSWFAAKAYCEWKGKELPSTGQWEYAAEDAGRDSQRTKEIIMAWYSEPNRQHLPKRGQGFRNGYGVYDLFGVIWEWTLDFNELTFDESPSGADRDSALFCGAGSAGALDASDYAKFMRYAFRSSLRADFTTANLGFRCVRNEPGEKKW